VTLPSGAAWCDDCEGEGRELVSRPSFDDPYYQHRTGRDCETCCGTGIVPTACDEDTDP